MLSMFGKDFSRHFEIFFLFFPENWISYSILVGKIR